MGHKGQIQVIYGVIVLPQIYQSAMIKYYIMAD